MVIEPSTNLPVSVHITVQVGETRKDFDAVAATDADGFKLADGILTGLREDAKDWLYDHKSH